MGPNGMRAFVRLRPERADLVVDGEIVASVDDELTRIHSFSTDPELEEVLRLALAPLPPRPVKA